MKIKGHDAVVPCHSCNIQGICVLGLEATGHYVPLNCSLYPEPGQILVYNAKNLPMHTHEEFMQNANSVVSAQTCIEEDRLVKDYGIKGKTIQAVLDSISFPHSFPYDFMHLIHENLIKNLILLWTNNFKDLDTSNGNYTFSLSVWEAIGAATVSACNTIPSVYSARLGSILGDCSTFTADNYSFWALYIRPILLQQ